jgi:UDP-2-acetamido-2-deoxy-ribo-hexuluronate aminotransferase
LIKFKDLQAQYQHLKTEIDAAIMEVLNEGCFINGRQVREFEEQLAQYVGVKHCISCANGTDALSLVLMAWNIGPDDAVFVPDFTFFATAEVVALRGATPVFVDVRADTFNIDTVKLEESIVEVIKAGRLRPRVIIPVDLFGLPADHIQIAAIAEKHNLLVLEDGAQGLGGSINGKMACSFGDAATTSFFPAKPLGCYGDGGAIFTDNDALAETIKSLKVHGKGIDKYDNLRVGLNSRLDTIQAALLSVKLKAFREFELQRVQELFALYNDALKEIVEIPVIPAGYTSSVAQYTIKLANRQERDSLKQKLADAQIPSFVYYPKPLHQQSVFENLQNAPETVSALTCSQMLSEKVLSLPFHAYLKKSELHFLHMLPELILSTTA